MVGDPLRAILDPSLVLVEIPQLGKGKTPFYLNVEVNRDPHAVERFLPSFQVCVPFSFAKSYPEMLNISP